jgi:hypothetical protein
MPDSYFTLSVSSRDFLMHVFAYVTAKVKVAHVLPCSSLTLLVELQQYHKSVTSVKGEKQNKQLLKPERVTFVRERRNAANKTSMKNSTTSRGTCFVITDIPNLNRKECMATINEKIKEHRLD